jgi:uncharacterized protein
MIKNRKAECALFLCMAAAVMFLVPPIQAVENKGKSMSAVETLMHSDRNIMELDGMLNHSYRAAMRAVSDRKKLKQEQLTWLKAVRSACKTTDCLEDVYCDRINELHDLEIKTLGVIEKPLTDDEARDICRTMAKLADTGELSLMAVPGKAFSKLDEADKQAGWGLSAAELAKVVSFMENDGAYESYEPSEIFKLKLKPASKPVLFGDFKTLGKCYSFIVHNLSMILSSDHVGATGDSQIDLAEEMVGLDNRDTVERYEGDSGEDVGNWTLGGREYPVLYRGRYYLVTKNTWHTLDPINKLAWITPVGDLRDLALFSYDESLMTVISTNDVSLSTGISRGEIEPLEFEYFSSGGKLMEKTAGMRVETAEILKADINGDRVVDNIVRFEFNIGGCGYAEKWIEVLSKDLKRIVKNELSRILSKYSVSEFYRYKGKYYLRSSDGHSGIFRFDKGKLIRVCTIENKTKTTMVRYAPFNPKKNETQNEEE